MAAAGTREHLRFCQIDGWTQLKSARGQGRDHVYFEKALEDGRTLRTKVSHGTTGKDAYSKGLWRHIWSEQLGLATEAEFWAVLKLKRSASRVADIVALPSSEPVPAWLVQCLLYTVGLRPDEVAALDKAGAEQRWQEFQTGPALSGLDEAATRPRAEHGDGLQVAFG